MSKSADKAVWGPKDAPFLGENANLTNGTCFTLMPVCPPPKSHDMFCSPFAVSLVVALEQGTRVIEDLEMLEAGKLHELTLVLS